MYDINQSFNNNGESNNVVYKDVFKREVVKQYYLIMDRMGDSLRSIHDHSNGHFCFKTTAQIGIQLVNILEKIHEAGYVFNDLKPDNILIGNRNILKDDQDFSNSSNNSVSIPGLGQNRALEQR